MTTTPYPVQLGTCAPRPAASPGEHYHGQLYYLPDADAIVVREHRVPGGWRCLVVARRRRLLGAGHFDVTDVDLAAAPTTMLVDPDRDPDSYAMMWQARVWQHWLGGPVHLGARTLADTIRQPGTLFVDIDPTAQRRLISATRLRTPGVRRLLGRLIAADLLTETRPGRDGSWGSYTLTVPTTGPTATSPPRTLGDRR